MENNIIVITTLQLGGAMENSSQLLLNNPWDEKANCLGIESELFFPERGASTREAKEVCRGCVVQESCLEFALTHSEKFGIWGGTSERERRRIRRQRALERPKKSA